MMNSAVYVVVLVLYFVLMVLIGYFGMKKSRSSVDYLLAGRNLPMWVMATALVASWFGSEVAIGASGVAFSKGLLGGAGIPFGWTACLLVMGILFTRKMRPIFYTTQNDVQPL